jgi:uncharacterized glyoxalase superfamily protein PhnB
MAELAAVLTAQGYCRVPLTRNGPNFLQTQATIGEAKVVVLVDASSAVTVVDHEVAHAHGLTVTLADPKLGGAYQIEGASLDLGTVLARPTRLLAIDFKGVTRAMTQIGGTPVQAILGLDVLQSQAGVVDYAGPSLFLKGEPGAVERVGASLGNRVVPSLLARDLKQTLHFYQDVLGFRVSGTYPDSENPCWAEVSRDGVDIMFHNAPPRGTLDAPVMSGTLYLYPNDVRKLADEYRGRVPFEWGPDVMVYGTREFGIRDPNGYYLAFAEPA